MNGFDYFVLAVPGSGSHMLATALDSHPQLNCFGELGRRNKYQKHLTQAQIDADELNGCILYCNGKISTKCIVLTRDPEDIVRRHRKLRVNTELSQHYYKPVEVKNVDFDVEDRLIGKSKNNVKGLFEALVDGVEYLHVTYEELCGNTDARVLGKSKEICEFLGVDVMDLVPATYKPSVAIDKDSC